MDDGLADLLHRVVSLLGGHARDRMPADDSLTYSQLRLLGTLDELAPLTQHQLAEAVAISDPAVSRALQPLLHDGLVAIGPDPAHGRRKLVNITASGTEAFHRTGRPFAEQLKQALLANDFPYERYLADTARLAGILADTATD